MHTKRQKCRVFKLRKITFMLLFLGCLSLGIFYYYFYITLNRYILQALRIILSILPFLIMISIIDGQELNIYFKYNVFPKFAGDKVDIFENEIRQQVYTAISCNSGIRFNHLRRVSGCASGQLQWHLKKLLKHQLIKIHLEENVKQYFTTRAQLTAPHSKKIILFSPIQVKIIHLLEEETDLSINLIAHKISRHKNTTRYHILKLIKKGIIEAEDIGKSKLLRLNRAILEETYQILD